MKSIKKNLLKLNLNIKKSNKNKSSHWQKHITYNNQFFDINKNHGFGSYENKSYKEIIYFILKRLVFKRKIFKTLLYRNLKNFFDSINRTVDADAIRHCFTLNLLKKYINPRSICIIGDGKLNGVLSAHLMFPLAKIYSVNLSETLAHDLLILNKLNLKIKNNVKIVDNLNCFTDSSKLVLVPSNFKKILMNKKIDLFINIASFQEMTEKEIKNYFKIVKNNKAMLYCCNREYKKLIGGEEIYFCRYPFSNSKIIFWENCPWHKKYYSLRYPFIKKFPNNVIHALVKFS